jgi:hypothetical protein
MKLFNILFKNKWTQFIFVLFLVMSFLPEAVECSGMDPNNTVSNINTVSPLDENSTKDDIFNSSSLKNSTDSIDSMGDLKSKRISSDSSSSSINVNFISDIPMIINTTVETVGKIVTSPAVVGAVASLGTAAILKQLPPVLKTLPPNQRAGVALGFGVATAVGQIFNNATKMFNQESNELASVAETPILEPKGRTGSPDSMKNDFINSPLENDFYSIPSILEFTSSEEALATGMLIGSAGTFYMVLTMLLSFSVRLFNLESREFVTKRPKLQKWLSLVAKGRDSTTLILMILILIILGEMVYGSHLLLYIIHSKSL